ncbi:glycosyltransferase family 2 protein [Paenibacillus sp. DYY-L-2]|uniref:glycosyltransferase family 2 protein n=1 Tax=Paenibacillus sp. DYY-L-2 TaxID=3447013 RepID=UPI003F50C046
MSFHPSVSIIFVVKNGGIDLYTTLESLKVSRTRVAYEVIIVNEGSVDGCCDFLMNYNFRRPIKLLKGEAGLPSRNVAAAHASGDYLIFCSPRLYFEDDWIESLLEPVVRTDADFASPELTVREASVVRPRLNDQGAILKSIGSYPWTGEDRRELAWLSSECFAVRRNRFGELGGMEEGFHSKEMETAELSLRVWLLGGSCRLVSQVSLTQVLRHNYPADDSWRKWEDDLRRIAMLHFHEGLGQPTFDHPEDLATVSREKYISKRIRDEAAFFRHFNISV